MVNPDGRSPIKETAVRDKYSLWRMDSEVHNVHAISKG
jgi:hypothetical protein